MFRAILFFAFMGVGFFYMIHVCLYLIGANIHDILKYLRSRRVKAKRQRYHPLVSVLIPAYNEELVIERCLQSVVKSRHRKLEVIVVSDASTDGTNRLVREFIARYPNKNIKLIARRRNRGKGYGLTYALQRHVNGELVMTLDADTVLARDAISNAVRYFTDERVTGLAANVRIIEDVSALNILQLFEYMISYRSKKFYTLTNAEFIIGGVGSVYRYGILKQFGFYDDLSATEDIDLSMKIAAHGNKDSRLMYAPDVVAYTESVSTITALLRQRYRWKYGNLQSLLRFTRTFIRHRKQQSKAMLWYRLPMAYISEFLLLLEPLLLTYALYLTVRSGNTVVFISAYMLLSSYCVLILWLDEHLKVRKKGYMTMFVPTLYLLFYIMSFIQIIAIFRCVAALPKIMKQQQSNTWVSPKRLGKAFNPTA